MRFRQHGLIAAALLLMTACAGPDHRPTSFVYLPGWERDSHAAALPAVAESCRAFARLADEQRLVYPGFEGTVADWRPICRDLAALPQGDDATARAFFERWFTPVSVADPEAEDYRTGLFTGYYVPEVRGSRTPSDRFRVPVYGPPPGDLASLSRAEIEAGALAGRGLEILWLDDAVDLFFMQIQGSGRVLLPDGSTVMLGYAGTNGHPYHAIGRTLIEWGEATREEMSMPFIRAWLEANPDRARALMNLNPAYIYFSLEDGFARGSLGRPLTPGRSLAVDQRTWSLGYPFWVDIDGVPAEGRLQRLMVAQDTGSAIRGPVRGDVFWGYGAEAGTIAGAMRAKGRYWALVPTAVVRRHEV